MKEISLNDKVTIRLTKCGADELNLYNKAHNTLLHSLNIYNIDARTNYVPNEYVDMQLSDLFNSFKEHNFNTGGEIPFTIHIRDYYEELPQQIKVDDEFYDLYIEFNPGHIEGVSAGYDKPKLQHTGTPDFTPLIVNGVQLNVFENTFEKACKALHDRLRDNRVTWDVIHIRKQITTSKEK